MAGPVHDAPLGTGGHFVKVFISYRRDDSKHMADRVYDRLVARFGKGNVFKDVDAIPLGADFRKVLEEAVQWCDVLLALLGERWTSITNEAGQRRLEDPNDFVRIEIEGRYSVASLLSHCS